MSKFFVITGRSECINTNELLIFKVSSVETEDGEMSPCVEYVLKHDLSTDEECYGDSYTTISKIRYAFFDTTEKAYAEWLRLAQFVGASS